MDQFQLNSCYLVDLEVIYLLNRLYRLTWTQLNHILLLLLLLFYIYNFFKIDKIYYLILKKIKNKHSY